MTVEEKKILRAKQTYERDEFFSMINTSFETKIQKYNLDLNWEDFSVYDTDIDLMRISYFSYKDFNNIRDIIIRTWGGGWGHLQSYINIQWCQQSYSIEMRICKDGLSETLSTKLKNKKEMTGYLIDFLYVIEPIKAKSLKRDYNLSLLLN